MEKKAENIKQSPKSAKPPLEKGETHKVNQKQVKL